MKSEIYNALAAINRSFDVALESLTILKNEGTLAADCIQHQTDVMEEVRAGINHMILAELETREAADWARFGKMRIETEARLDEA